MNCKTCNIDKAENMFSKGKKHCKECLAKEQLLYGRSAKGRITIMYSNMKKRAKARGVRCPLTFNIDEFKEWILNNQEDFDAVYLKWVNNDYDKDFTPTIDRIDSHSGYKFSNMRIVSYSDNVNFYRTDMMNKKGVNQKLVAVKCYTLDDKYIGQFRSLADASFFINQTVSSVIRECIDGKRRSAGGYKWVAM